MRKKTITNNGTNHIKLSYPITIGTANSNPDQAFLEFVKNVANPMAAKKLIVNIFLIKFLDLVNVKAILKGHTKFNHDPA